MLPSLSGVSTSAWCSISSPVILLWWLAAALCNGVAPLASVARILAPRASSSLVASSSGWCVTMCNGVVPASFGVFGLAPWSSNTFVGNATLEVSNAVSNGVSPAAFGTFGLAPASSRTFAIS